MLLIQLSLLNLLIIQCNGYANRDRFNNILLRRKRYLAFPSNSNFVISMSLTKGLLRRQPRGWNILGECDVPFALPNDTRWFRHRRDNRAIQRREIFNQIETAFFDNGMNGAACLKRIICEAQQYIGMERKSFVRDIVSTIFESPELDLGIEYHKICDKITFIECEIPFMHYILNSLLSYKTGSK